MTCPKCGCTVGYDCFCEGCPGCGARSPERCNCGEPDDSEFDNGEPDFTVDPNDPTHPGWEA